METSSKEFSDMAMANSDYFQQLYDQFDLISYSSDDFGFQTLSPYCEDNLNNNGPNTTQVSDHSSNQYMEAYGDQSLVYGSPIKRPKTESESCTAMNIKNAEGPPKSPSCATQIISFDFPTNDVPYGSPIHGQGIKRKNSSGSTRTPLLAKEHVIAERKRREKLSQRFIALSALLPGLKKADKASILGDAIKYLTQLQGRIKTLEEQRESNKKMESAILLRKLRLSIDDDASPDHDENCDTEFDEPLPEIVAKICKQDVLIRIHLEKGNNSTIRVLDEIERLNLSVLNSIVLPFGSSTLDITVLAKVEAGSSMTAKDLVRRLRLAILRIM